jgi:hypothetical protein
MEDLVVEVVLSLQATELQLVDLVMEVVLSCLATELLMVDLETVELRHQVLELLTVASV